MLVVSIHAARPKSAEVLFYVSLPHSTQAEKCMKALGLHYQTVLHAALQHDSTCHRLLVAAVGLNELLPC